MNDPVLENATRDLVADSAVPAQMLKDFYVLAGVEEEICRRVHHLLEGFQVGDDLNALPGAIESLLPESSSTLAEPLLRLAMTVSHDQVDEAIDWLKSWTESAPDRSTIFPSSVLERIKRNLSELTGVYPALELHQKATALLHIVGNEFVDATGICDLRPIFDDQRENVLGFALISTLRLEYLSQEGDVRVFELTLTEEELAKVHDETTRVLDKMNRLKPVGLSFLGRNLGSQRPQ